MEKMMRVEVVDQQGRVISQHDIAADDFPLTVRLVNGTEIVTTPATRPAVAPSPTPAFARWRWLYSRAGVLALSVFMIALFAISIAAKTYGNSNAGDAIGIALFMWTGLVIWAGLWALGGRVAHNPARFREQVLWTSIATLALIVGRMIFTWGEFLFPASTVIGTITSLLLIVMGLVMLYGHITIASRASRGARVKVVGMLAIVFAAIAGLAAYAKKDKFDTDLSFLAIVKPLDARLIPSETPDQFTAAIAKMREDVDNDAKGE